jgi:hypothetical protein
VCASSRSRPARPAAPEVAEVADALTQTFRGFGKILAPKQQNSYSEDDEKFYRGDSSHSRSFRSFRKNVAIWRDRSLTGAALY